MIDADHRREKPVGAYPETGRLRRLTVVERAAILQGAGAGVPVNVAAAVDRCSSDNVPDGVERLVQRATAIVSAAVGGCRLAVVIVYANGVAINLDAEYDAGGGIAEQSVTARGFTVPAGAHVDGVDFAGAGGNVTLHLLYVDVLP